MFGFQSGLGCWGRARKPVTTRMRNPVLVTGGAGFIGSNFVLQQMQEKSASVVNLDKLTYAGNLHNLESIASDGRHKFVQGDIGDRVLVRQLLEGLTIRVRLFTSRPRAMSTGRFAVRKISFARMSTGPSPCWKKPERTGARCRTKRKRISASCTFPLTKYSARSGWTIRLSVKRPRTPRTAHMPRLKRRPTTWCEPTITPTDCRR